MSFIKIIIVFSTILFLFGCRSSNIDSKDGEKLMFLSTSPCPYYYNFKEIAPFTLTKPKE